LISVRKKYQFNAWKPDGILSYKPFQRYRNWISLTCQTIGLYGKRELLGRKILIPREVIGS